jgi:hypothetical protein
LRKVKHTYYGEGKVLKSRYGGAEVFVEFESGISRWIRDMDLDHREFVNKILKKEKPDFNLHSQEPGQKIVKKTKERFESKALDNIKYQARANIEALRMGLFPDNNIEDFTFGRKKEKEFVQNWLHNSSEGSLIMTGVYGVGKTHFLEYINNVAMKDNWAVSFLEFDSNSLPLNKPKLLYQEIIRAFKYKNGDFKDFMNEVAKSSNYILMKEHAHLSTMIKRIRNDTDFDYCWDWIYGKLNHSGKSAYLPPIYTYSTAANIFCYILSGIGYAAKEVLGLNGFIIFFDEAENIDPYWYSSYQRAKGWNFLEGLILMTNNSTDLLQDRPFNEVTVSNRKSNELRGRLTNLQYNNKLQHQYIWKIPCSVRIVMGFTPYETLLSKKPLNRLSRLELNKLDPKALQEIATEITTFYYQAYNYQTDKERSHLPSELLKNYDATRLYIKSLVEILDLTRFHPKKPLNELLQ